MKAKNLLILAALAAVLAALAALTSRERGATRPPESGRLMLPDLPVNDVAGIAIVSPAGTSRVARAAEKWVVPDRYGYPADFGKVKNFVLRLSELKTGQLVRADAAQRRRLRMLPPGAGASAEETGTLVQLSDTAGATVAEILVGSTRTRAPAEPGGYGYPDGTYVSTDGGEKVYLVGEVLENLPASSSDWMNPELLNIAAQEAARITISGPGRGDLELRRSEESSQFTLPDLAADQELDTSRLYALEAALTHLHMEDVSDPSLDAAVTGLDAPVVFTLETAQGEVYTVRVGGAEGDDDSARRYAQIEVALAEAPPEAPAAETDQAPNEDRAGRVELEQKVAGLNARLSGWTFLLPPRRAEVMTRTRDDLVKPKEEEEDQP